jgi:septal ring factor EnvC (AmiA/AmiB activator)
MAKSGFDPTDPRVQLELVTRDLRHEQEKVRELKESLTQIQSDLIAKERELNNLKDERGDLKLNLGLATRDLKHIKESKTSKQRAFYATLILALASGSAGWGTNLLTSAPPNQIGFILLAVAAILYYIGARLTTLLA